MTMDTEINWTLLMQFWELMEDEGEGVEELIQTFLDDAPKQLANAEAALQAQNFEELRRIAHILKGSSSTIGSVRFSENCRIVERAIKLGERRDFQQEFNGLKESYSAFESILKNWRRYLQAPEF